MAVSGVSSGSSGSQSSSCQDMGLMADPCDPCIIPSGALSLRIERETEDGKMERPSDAPGGTVEQGSNCENSLAVPLKVRRSFPHKIQEFHPRYVPKRKEPRSAQKILHRNLTGALFTTGKE